MRNSTFLLLWLGLVAIGIQPTKAQDFRLRLYAPGDYGSRNWRIPAIRALPDSSLLVVNDRRKYNEGDLPEDIDIVARRSTDNGRTWSEPVTIVKCTGRGQGYGDPALVTTSDGDVICAFAGGNGFFASTEANPIRTFIARSHDSGQTWSIPEDITALIWGSKALNPACRIYEGGFCASGNGLLLTRGPHAGRILFATALCRNHQEVDNYVLYSDDQGHTWQVSQLAYRGGDEAKMVELSDGRILLSVRQNGARGHNISEDGGATWGTQGTWPEMTTNACNGDIISTTRGNQEILLHSITNSMKRENVSIFVSYDLGKSWTTPRTLCRGKSVYSSLTLLPDSTIGAYIEENTPNGCELWYINLPFDW